MRNIWPFSRPILIAQVNHSEKVCQNLHGVLTPGLRPSQITSLVCIIVLERNCLSSRAIANQGNNPSFFVARQIKAPSTRTISFIDRKTEQIGLLVKNGLRNNAHRSHRADGGEWMPACVEACVESCSSEKRFCRTGQCASHTHLRARRHHQCICLCLTLLSLPAE